MHPGMAHPRHEVGLPILQRHRLRAFPILETCHCPPRAVRMCGPSARAIPQKLVTPVAWIARITGSTLAADWTAAASAFAARPRSMIHERRAQTSASPSHRISGTLPSMLFPENRTRDEEAYSG